MWGVLSLTAGYWRFLAHADADQAGHSVVFAGAVSDPTSKVREYSVVD
jgi:hypothetical protein